MIALSHSFCQGGDRCHVLAAKSAAEHHKAEYLVAAGTSGDGGPLQHRGHLRKSSCRVAQRGVTKRQKVATCDRAQITGDHGVDIVKALRPGGRSCANQRCKKMSHVNLLAPQLGAQIVNVQPHATTHGLGVARGNRSVTRFSRPVPQLVGQDQHHCLPDCAPARAYLRPGPFSEGANA